VPDLPFGTIFTPNVWLDQPEGDQPLGEVPGAPRTWVDGSPPFPVAGTGPPCGTAAQFQGQQSYPWDVPAVNVYGGLACCPTPPAPFVHFDCGFCPNGAWSDYTLVTVGGDPFGPFGPSNGAWDLRYQGGCIWRSTQSFALPLVGPGLFSWVLEPVSSFGWITQIQNHSALATWLVNPWDCLASRQAPATAILGPIPPGVPTSVWIVPGLPAVEGNTCVILGHALPTTIIIRVPAGGPGVLWSVAAGDYPFTQTTPCTYAGPVWWRGVRLPGLPRIQWRLRSVAGVIPGPQLTYLLVAPDTSTYLYRAVAGDWDGVTPIALIRDPGFTLLGVPDRLMIFNPDFPPP
jgi:hypothetical protein